MRVAPSQQHANGTTHRIANGDDRRYVERLEQRRSIVGNVFQLELIRQAQASPVTAVVERDEGAPLGQCLDTQ